MAKNNIYWGNVKRIDIPNFRNGDIFFVVRKDKIVAIRLSDSFINMQGGSCWNYTITGIATPANGSKVLSGKVSMSVTDDGTIEVLFLDNEFSCCSTHVYNSVEDAQNGIISRKSIDLTSLPIYTKGFIGGYIEVGGYDDYLILETWEISDNAPQRVQKTIKTMLFHEDGVILSYYWKPLVKVGSIGYETEHETWDVIRNRAKKYKVCTFEDKKEPEKKELSITIKITADMSPEDITRLVLEKLGK